MKRNIKIPAQYAEIAVLDREIATIMLDRLELVARQPQRILDVGCSVGFCTQLLKKRYPSADIIAVENSQEILAFAQHGLTAVHWMCAESDNLPFAQQTMDLIVANVVTPWCANLKKLLTEWRRVLRPEGLLVFSSFGPSTLMEFKEVISFTDPSATVGPWFRDMHDLGDELILAGFADPILDVEHFTLKYRKQEQLLHELHITGMINEFTLLKDNLPLSLTYEVIYGHAWAPTVFGSKADDSGVVRIPLSHLRGHKLSP